MSQYSDGKISITQDTQDVFGVFEIPVTNASGTFVAGEALSFPTSQATGLVTSWNASTEQLRFTVQSTDQPVVDESVVGVAATGTVGDFTFRPTFVGNISWGHLFVPLGEERVSYEVGTVPTRSHFTLTSQFVNTSLSDSEYIVSTSFAPHNQVPYPETGDQQPVEVIKRAIIDLDGMVVAASGLATLSGSLQGQLDAQETESWPLFIPFPGSGIDGLGNGSENVFWTIDYDLDAVSVRAKTVSGTLDYTLKFNDVIIEGLDNQTVTTSEVVSTATSALSYTANDEILLAISGSASATDLRWTLRTVRT